MTSLERNIRRIKKLIATHAKPVMTRIKIFRIKPYNIKIYSDEVIYTKHKHTYVHVTNNDMIIHKGIYLHIYIFVKAKNFHDESMGQSKYIPPHIAQILKLTPPSI